MTIGTEQYEILDLGMAALLHSINDVVKSRLAFVCNFQTHCERFACRGTSIGFFLWQVAKRITSLVHSFKCLRARTFRNVFLYILIFALFPWREVAIRLAFLEQTIGGSAMCGRVGRLENEIFVVVESEPLSPSMIERVDSSVERCRSVSSMRSRNLPPVFRA